MSSFEIRVATPGDEAAVGNLLAASYAALLHDHYPPALLAAALPLITRANPVLLASGTYYLAKAAGGHIVGCGGWTPERPGSGDISPGIGHLRHFATHPDWTLNGIAAAILGRSIGEAAARAIPVLECFSTRQAEGFYARAGFRRLAEVEVPFAPDVHFPAVYMRRGGRGSV